MSAQNLPIDSEAAAKELRTLRDLIRWGASHFQKAGLFFGHGTETALDESAWLVLHALSLPLDLASQYHDCRLTLQERQQIIKLLEKRIYTRKPAAYLTGEAWFCGLPFFVNESVLVPRSPIAELIEKSFLPWLDGVNVTRILDLCTGSGCIGIASAYAFPQAQVDLTDISEAALEVAWHNIVRHELQMRINLFRSDVFEQLPKTRYELIISNPPYVDAQEMASLPAEYRREPALGLAAGEDGLDIVRRIIGRAGEFLTHSGLLVVEVGNSRPALEQVYTDLGFTWLDLEHGGDGIFVITAAELKEWMGH